MSWKNDTGADSYVIKRNGVVIFKGVATGSTVGYEDKTITKGVTYTYSVYGVNDLGASATSYVKARVSPGTLRATMSVNSKYLNTQHKVYFNAKVTDQNYKITPGATVYFFITPPGAKEKFVGSYTVNKYGYVVMPYYLGKYLKTSTYGIRLSLSHPKLDRSTYKASYRLYVY